LRRFISTKTGLKIVYDVVCIISLFLPAGFAAKRQTAGIKFTQEAKKISIFAPRGDSPIHVKFDMDKGHAGPLGCAKFHFTSISAGVGTWLQNIQNFHFLVKSRPAGANPLTNFYTF